MATSKNGPSVSTMYTMKPFYDRNAQTELPECMYKMKRIYNCGSSDENHLSKQEFVNSTVSKGGIEELEQRQNNILSKLNDLRLKVDALKTKYISSQGCTQSFVQHDPQQQKQSLPHPVTVSTASTITDLVISASPSSPPLSLFILSHMLSSQCRVLFSTYVHSSAKALVTQKHLDVFQNRCFPVHDRNSYKFGITLIWKDEPYGPALMVQPGQQTPIRGEANVARYIARLLSPPYEVDIVKATEIDNALDLASALLQSDQNQSLNIINLIVGSLGSGKGSLLGGGQPTLADVVVWSAVKQRAAGKLPGNLQQWMERSSNLPIFKDAAHLF